ncbi:MAG: sigma-54 interaction domain-containing protein [Chloroflexota bacterium]
MTDQQLHAGADAGMTARFLERTGYAGLDEAAAALAELAALRDINEFSTTLLNSLFEKIIGGMVIADATGRIIRMNATYARLLDAAPEQYLGQPVSVLPGGDDLQRALRTGEANPGRIGMIKGVRHVHIELPLFHQGKVVGVLGQILSRELDTVKALFEQVSRLDDFRQENRAVKANHSFSNIWGEAEPFRRAKALAEKAARTDLTVLVQGESGTGKELFAQAIHNASARAGKPLVAINCAAIPDTLLEAELFGYEGGSFTGARRTGKPGKFEQADGGTLFLDEIGDMPLPMQAKLLRAIQAGEIEKVGATQRVKVDVRLIAATNQDLARLVEEGRFREDLYYRLNVVRIELPPLRERPGDIRLLAGIFSERFCAAHSVDRVLSEEAMELLLRYRWPGNVRELENAIETAMWFADGPVVQVGDLPGFIREHRSGAKYGGQRTLDEIVAEVERDVIVEALEATGNNKLRTAKILGLPRSSLYEKLSKYNL